MTRQICPTGPACPACGEVSYRAVRMHRAADSDRCYLIAIRWACGRCGLRFTDPSLEEFNGAAQVASAACSTACA